MTEENFCNWIWRRNTGSAGLRSLILHQSFILLPFSNHTYIKYSLKYIVLPFGKLIHSMFMKCSFSSSKPILNYSWTPKTYFALIRVLYMLQHSDAPVHPLLQTISTGLRGARKKCWCRKVRNFALISNMSILKLSYCKFLRKRHFPPFSSWENQFSVTKSGFWGHISH